MPMMNKLPPVIAERGCGACHAIGRDDGKCNSCHTRHTFATAEARKPEACQTCHMGIRSSAMGDVFNQQARLDLSNAGRAMGLAQETRRLVRRSVHRHRKRRTAPRPALAATCRQATTRSERHGVFSPMRSGDKDPEWQKYRNTIFRGLGVIDEKGEPTDRFKAVVAGQMAARRRRIGKNSANARLTSVPNATDARSPRRSSQRRTRSSRNPTS